MPRATPWRRALRAHVQEVLASLGNGPDEIARQLEEAGVRGTPHNQEDCAIAVYLSAVVGADPEVRRLRVRCERVVVESPRWYRHRVSVRLSRPLQEFVACFDHGIYPQLTRDQPASAQRDQRATHQGHTGLL